MRYRRFLLFGILVSIITFIYHFMGVNDHIYSKDFDKQFDYPLNVDVKHVVDIVLMNKEPPVKPINHYPFKYLTNSGTCHMVDRIDMLILIKSAIGNFEQRSTLRDTWAQEHNLPGRMVKVLFFVGQNKSPPIQHQLDEEKTMYNDIIQMNFNDSYFNNTVKTMMMFRWAFNFCNTADFYFFVDDDMYVSVSNLLDYVENPYASKEERSETSIWNKRDSDLFSGYVFESAPHRHKTSKWRVSIDEYPWNRWPPYVTAGAYVLTNKSMKKMYLASLFVKHFRFDDIYLGIVAKKVGIVPLHCPNFYFYKKSYSKEDYKKVIASHGYGDRDELTRVWKEQNAH